MERLLPLRKLCRLLAVPRKTLLAWIDAGEFPEPIQLPDQSRRWRASTVAAWLATLAGGELVAESFDVSNLPVLGQEIIQALAESETEFLKGPDLAAKVGVDTTNGNWGRAIRALKGHRPQLLGSERRGYRLTAAGRAYAATNFGSLPGSLPADCQAE